MNRLNTKRGTTAISNHFIDELLPTLSKEAVAVYLLRERIGNEDRALLAERLRLGEAEISAALAELKERGLVSSAKTPVVEAQPVYTVGEIELFSSGNEEVRRLFSMAEYKLGKPLKYNEMNLFLSFYDWLRLPVDVIGFMLDRCVENGTTAMRYIEKVALDWSENGIDSMEKAQAHLHKFDVYRRIMNAFSISGSRNPKPKEIAQMDKWLKEYCFSVELIAEAAERTVTNTGNASFAYAEGILSKWHGEGVKSLEDVKDSDNRFEQNKSKPEAQIPPPAKSSKRKFQNYEGREWNQDSLVDLQSLERERLKKILNEKNED